MFSFVQQMQWVGTRVAPLSECDSLHEFAEGEPMRPSLECPAPQYAVIAGLRTEELPERLVVAYPDEESLRGLIAASSIIALGFNSREEAVKHAERCFQTALGPDRATSGRVTDRPKSPDDFPSRKNPFVASFEDTWKTVSHLVQYALTLGITILYSRRAVSVAIRAFVGM